MHEPEGAALEGVVEGDALDVALLLKATIQVGDFIRAYNWSWTGPQGSPNGKWLRVTRAITYNPVYLWVYVPRKYSGHEMDTKDQPIGREHFDAWKPTKKGG